MTSRQVSVTEHVQGNSMIDMTMNSNPINRFLHLAVTTIPAFHRVRRRRKKFVVQKNEALLQRRRFQLRKHLRQVLETPHPLSQFPQFQKRRFRAATTVEQAVHLVFDLSQFAQLRKTFRDFPERFTFRSSIRRSLIYCRD